MSESDLQQLIQIEAVKYGCQLLRNNSGQLRDLTGRPVRYGLGNISKQHNERIKSSDLIGFMKIELPPTMPGRLAIFVAVEVKEPGWKFNPKDKREVAQSAFLDWVRMHGGCAGFAQSIDDFKRIIGVL